MTANFENNNPTNNYYGYSNWNIGDKLDLCIADNLPYKNHIWVWKSGQEHKLAHHYNILDFIILQNKGD